MDIKKPLILFVLSLLVFTGVSQTMIIQKSDLIESKNGKSYFVHTVMKGQTVYSISKAYNVTPDEIYFENPGSKQGINIGQKLYIPTVNKETELKQEVSNTSFDFFYHVAANNETYEQIGSIYLIPAKYIRKANPGLVPPFREGEYVKVPVEEAFDILDGVSTKVLTDNSVNYNNNRNYNTSTNQGNIRPDKPADNSKQINKPQSETVSFDPGIPIIQDYRHVVILGETTSTIAKKYGIPVEVLKAANPGLGNTVQKGDRLRVPDKTKIKDLNDNKALTEPAVADFETKTDTSLVEYKKTTIKEEEQENIIHIVRKKETLYSIGREYGLTVDELIQANPGLTTLIKIGQKIIVPKKKITLPYLIYKPDKITKINKVAKLFKIPVYQIRDFNPGIGSRLYPEQEVKIPVGSNAIIVPYIPEIEEINETEAEFEEHPVNMSDCDFRQHPNKVFRVALMIPLSLEESDSLDLNQFYMAPKPYFKPFRFIKFYEGALMAIDSLTGMGANIRFYVYDVDKNITKTAKVLQEPELKTMDLIIGPFFNTSFNQVALFAGNFNIPIVNPLSYRDAVVNDYKTVYRVKSGSSYQEPVLKEFIKKYAPNSKVFLISQTSYLDADMVTTLRNGVQSVINNQVKVSNQDLFGLSYDVAERDSLYERLELPPPFIFENTEIYPEILENTLGDSTTINNTLVKINYSVDSLYPFYESASPIRNNLVILYGTKKSFILDVLNRLNESRDTFDIQLVGMPTWERINNLNNIKMNNLKVSYFTTGYIDYENDNIQEFIVDFRERYNTEPDNYAFSGFDITYYFLSALYFLDKDIDKCIEEFPLDLLLGKYHFRRVGNTNNYINKYWHMLQIRDLERIKIHDELITPDSRSYYYD